MDGLDSLQDFRRFSRANAPRIRKAERIVPLTIVLGVLGLVFGAIGVFAFVTLDDVDDPGERWEQFAVSLIGIVAAVFFLFSIGYSIWVFARRWRRRRAAAELALSRGWHYNLEWDPRAYPAALFSVGGNAWVENAMHLHEPRYVEVGNYSFASTQRAAGRQEVGFVGIGLDRRLPHMYLESTHRGKPRAYIPAYRTDQRMSLEGDFDRWFRLSRPGGYETDALYVLTPDVMALLIDEAPGFDVEIVDDWMFVVAREPFDMTDGRVLDFAQRVTATLGSRTGSRSQRYVDERSDHAAFVDEAGARLKTGRWVVTVVPALLTGIAWIAIAWANGLIAF
jgi:hypothetical protein